MSAIANVSRRLVTLILGFGILGLALTYAVQPTRALSSWTYLHTSGGNILDANNQVVHLSGVNWFGAETTDCTPDGLWSRNWKDMLNQIKSLGYNIIRLPYSTDFMTNAATGGGCRPANINFTLNPDLADLAADPNGRTALKAIPLFDKIIGYAGSIGLRILLDRHRAENTQQSPLWYDLGSAVYTEARWISDWTWLAQHYANNPTVIGADLHNEPHSISGNPGGSACWGCGNPATDWRLAAERAGNAILQVNPHWLIVVEGTDNDAVGSYWWGGALGNAGPYPVALNVPNQLVYSAHEYPASIYAQSWFSDPTYPNNLPSVWNAHWGYLQIQGIAPVLIGEFGSWLQTQSDQQWFNALTIGPPGSGYIKSNGFNWTFWSLNPNSGDTGGLLNNDWTTVVQAKQSVLAQVQYPLIGVPMAGSTNTPTVGPSPTATKAPTNTPVGGPSPIPTNTPIPNSTATNPPTPGPNGLKVAIDSSGSDNNQETQFHFLVKNTGGSAQSGVSVHIYFTLDGTNPASSYVLEKYYDQSGSATVSGPTLACASTYYFTVNYGSSSLAAGGQWEFQTALHLSSWASTFNSSNDWYHSGYPVGALPASYADTIFIPLYLNGVRTWGGEPACSATTATPIPTATLASIAASSTAVLTIQPGTGTPAPCTTIRVDAGSSGPYMDSSAHVWSADSGAVGGSTVNRGSITIANTGDPTIYQTEHYAMSSYSFAVANCTYTVSLHFAETYFTSSGQRKFSVALQGTTVLSNFDVFADAGGKDIADVKTFTISVTNGTLTIQFTPILNNPEINGIQIVPS